MTMSSHRCAPVREWISLALDGELSRFEQLLLQAHLARCPACRTFQDRTHATTEALRAAPLLPLEQPITADWRRRRRAADVLRPFAAAAATIVIVLGTVAISARPSEHPLRAAQADDVRVGVEALREFQRTRREARVERAIGASSRPFQRPASVAVPLTPQ
jgi:predicted anti-sigma-YlaC factor YlaD